MAGTLFIVATPIGNLSDLNFRALETLKTVDLIAAEDTRHTKHLLDRYEIKTPLVRYDQVSAQRKTAELVELLQNGKQIALVSDAGTPGIADPGGQLVAAARVADIQVVPIPGSSAPATLLSVSGKPADQFLFVGFLPKKKGRQTLLKKLQTIGQQLHWPLVFFESPERIGKTFVELQTYFPSDSPVVVGRELTKQFEEIWTGSLADAATHFEKGRGEFVFAVWPA